MSDDTPAVFGADMVPMTIPDFAVVEVSPVVPTPVTEAEKDEVVNAAALRRTLYEQVDALVSRVRALSVEGPASFQYAPGIVRKATPDIEVAIGRYLDVERKFRKVR